MSFLFHKKKPPLPMCTPAEWMAQWKALAAAYGKMQ